MSDNNLPDNLMRRRLELDWDVLVDPPDHVEVMRALRCEQN
jgi:hypothetical protein